MQAGAWNPHGWGPVKGNQGALPTPVEKNDAVDSLLVISRSAHWTGAWDRR